ncbi:MAG: 2-C-methyl-D-erythritol 4-phosphate cytidylyltransferase [Ruminococcus sp.]|nr:2-C-methyl-D-erythritol 4-phosphate cytidylyltransferase [Ruminococcus sp.]
MRSNYVTAIIVAAGNSSRMGGNISKQFISLNEKTVIEHTLTAFENCSLIDEIVVVAREQDIEKINSLVKKNSFTKVSHIAVGGNTRGESVANGINASSDISDKTHFFAIHDGARPLVLIKDIENVIKKAFEVKSATLGVMVKDTIKITDDKNIVVSTPNRADLRSIQTPQIFEKGLYISALNKAKSEGKDFTDDCQLVENFGKAVEVVIGSESNIKLTTPIDVIMAESILKAREQGEEI